MKYSKLASLYSQQALNKTDRSFTKDLEKQSSRVLSKKCIRQKQISFSTHTQMLTYQKRLLTQLLVFAKPCIVTINSKTSKNSRLKQHKKPKRSNFLIILNRWHNQSFLLWMIHHCLKSFTNASTSFCRGFKTAVQ